MTIESRLDEARALLRRSSWSHDDEQQARALLARMHNEIKSMQMAQLAARSHLRALGEAVMLVGDGRTLVDRGADAINTALESLLAGHRCEVCGRLIQSGEGAFERVADRGLGDVVVITCGRCHEPKGATCDPAR